MENRASNGREVGKHHEMFWMAQTEALISAVERRCIPAIERARGGAGRFGFVYHFWFLKKGCKGSSRCKSEPRVNWSMGFLHLG
jgi:hypothetical protein